jgi:hypothetical protein
LAKNVHFINRNWNLSLRKIMAEKWRFKKNIWNRQEKNKRNFNAIPWGRVAQVNTQTWRQLMWIKKLLPNLCPGNWCDTHVRPVAYLLFLIFLIMFMGKIKRPSRFYSYICIYILFFMLLSYTKKYQHITFYLYKREGRGHEGQQYRLLTALNNRKECFTAIE